MIEFGERSLYYSKLVRSKAKMIEFDIPLENHISISEDSHKSFLVALAIVANSARKYFEDYINHNNFDPHLKNQLHNAAEFFDALILSGLGNANEYRDYIAILGATAYYLGDYNGSSSVMLSYISDAPRFPEDSFNLVKVLIDILTDRVFVNYESIVGIYSDESNILVEQYRNYILEGREISIEVFKNLQDNVYSIGSDFSIIIVNCLLAIVCKKINCSSTKLLPEFSGLEFSLWQNYIQSEGSIKELWPSQIELGVRGIFSGKSGIIQMPTSSGKTASVNLILRSAFYSNRIDNALIIAPFRALCREICRDINRHFVNDEEVFISEIFDLPEIPQDFSIFNDGKKRVFILTPEKLLFLLRNHQSFINEIGLCIFDEAHLFDDPSRGTNFELLLSTVKQIFPKEIQKILISAVIPDSEAINQWFNEDGVIVSNNSIKTTEKRVAFSDLKGSNEQLYFIDPITFEEEFFVPRTVSVTELEQVGKERKQKVFPELTNANDLSIYYGTKLINNGGVGIFCGRKDKIDTSLVETEIIAKNSIGLYQSKLLKEWVQENITSILSCEKEEDLLSVLTEIIMDFSNNKQMKKLSIENLNFISQFWIKGNSYFQILESCTEKSIRIEKRGKLKPIDMSDIISICDNGLGYETSMVLNAINNNLEKIVGDGLEVLTMLIKKLKYGLPLEKEINIYELGFSDRIVAQVIGQEINSQSKDQIKNEIKRKSAGIEDKLSDFPSYYIQLINEI